MAWTPAAEDAAELVVCTGTAEAGTAPGSVKAVLAWAATASALMVQYRTATVAGK